MNSRDRDYWRRRDDNIRASKKEGRRVYWDLTRKIRETDNAGRRHRLAADHLDSEISRTEYSEKLTRHLEDMRRQKSFLLKQISTCDVRRTSWYQQLDDVKLTAPEAIDQLQNLLAEVERHKRLWSKLPRMSASLNGLLGKWSLPETADCTPPKASSSINPLVLRFEREAEQQELQRQMNESALALIVSSLSLSDHVRASIPLRFRLKLEGTSVTAQHQPRLARLRDPGC